MNSQVLRQLTPCLAQVLLDNCHMLTNRTRSGCRARWRHHDDVLLDTPDFASELILTAAQVRDLSPQVVHLPLYRDGSLAPPMTPPMMLGVLRRLGALLCLSSFGFGLGCGFFRRANIYRAKQKYQRKGTHHLQPQCKIAFAPGFHDSSPPG